MTHFTFPGATPHPAFIYHQEIKKKKKKKKEIKSKNHWSTLISSSPLRSVDFMHSSMHITENCFIVT